MSWFQAFAFKFNLYRYIKALASPVTWVVFSHVEIPIVAVMSYTFLSRPLTRTQWIATALLLDGVMASEISLCHAVGRVARRFAGCPLVSPVS
jgi:drug/metabolite transporter (DMT)-like permease